MPSVNGPDEDPVAASVAAGFPAVPLRSSADDYIDAEEVSGIYLRVLEHPIVHREQLVEAGFEVAEIDDALHLFEWRGLVQRIDENRWRVLPPDVVVPSFAARLEEHARQLRASAPSLSRIYQRADEPDSTQARRVTQLRGIDEILRAVHGIYASSNSRVVSLRAQTPHTRHLISRRDGGSAIRPVNAQGQPLTVEAIYDIGLLEIPGFLDFIETRQRMGEVQRLTPGLPFSLTAGDTGRVVIDTAGTGVAGSDTGGIGILLTTESAQAAAVGIFEFIWRLSSPWRPDSSPDESVAGPRPSPPERDLKMLQLMASGATDSTISRQLGISQRTVERRVKAYMDSVNAVTRFQAAVVAAKQGLV